MTLRRLSSLFAALMALLLMLSLSSTALADMGRIQTPGGPVKMRKKDSAKSKLVTQIPNRSIVEIIEAGDEWSLIEWQGKTGYVKNEYLLNADQMPESALKVTLNEETSSVGSVLEITASCENAVAYQYVLTIGKGKAIKSSQIPYDKVYFRPRKAGKAVLEVTAWYADDTSITNELFFDISSVDVSAAVENIEDGFVLFSQKDGWWLNKKYGSSNLDASGCAIFTLSHALQLMGKTSPAERPENLAPVYAFCLRDGGTVNETLIGRSAKNYGFTTKSDLLKDQGKIATKLQEGAMFTFAIVKGHIALISGLSEDGTKVKIIDSAPSVTLERINGSSMYIPDGNSWQAISSMEDFPDARYFFETDNWGGQSYYLDLSYVAGRGVRLIQP